MFLVGSEFEKSNGTSSNQHFAFKIESYIVTSQL